MPTAVATARQCLTEEAARALDDAVTVAKRRNHAQTTSLHAVSALLSPSFSLLRESLSRARSSAYSPRLQFRALELCVGVSLDRLPSSKSVNDDFAPPISNSLMAAIKRSQANQRRQPEMYHLNQIHINNTNSGNNSNNPMSISSIKVELKHFVLSILDDPIVSRVFGEAGFKSSDIKLAIIHPPARWSPTTRCPPLFLCNLMDFQGFDNENCRRIGEVMVRKRERNPLLVGVCAKDALSSFKECLEKGRFAGFPSELHGLKLVCLEEFVGKKKKKDMLYLKLNEVRLMLENCSNTSGVVVNLGELNVLDNGDGDDGEDDEGVKELVMKLSELIEVDEKKKLWLIGAAASYETYSNFVGRFPCVEKNWDLQPLPITSSSRSSIDGLGSKSSLMGSFVPFGGFFPTTSDFIAPLTALKQPFTRCNSCNEKYEQELCAMLREGSSASIGDQCSPSLPSWLQRAEPDMSKGGDVVSQVKDVKKASSNEQILGLQKKWNDHCRHHHHHHQGLIIPPVPGVSLSRPQLPHTPIFPFSSEKQASGGSSCSTGDSSVSSSGMQLVPRNISPPQQQIMTVDFPKRAFEIADHHSPERNSSASLTYPIPSLGKPPSTVSVTTDLGLGTIYASKLEEQKKPSYMQHFPGPIFTNRDIISKRDSGGFVPGDYKLLITKLCEAVSWQSEAICKISEIVSCCRSGNVRGNIWLTFLGPDKIGKRKIAGTLAEAMFGSKDRLITVDLSSQDKISKVNSLFLCQGSRDYDINTSRMTVVDHIAQELCRKPHCVVFLENVDEADPLVQSSLSRAVQTGRFQDSRRREISINNAIFVLASSIRKDDKTPSPRKEFIKFSEEKVLEAKNWQMKISVRSISGNASRSNNEITVSLVSTNSLSSDQATSSKRKFSDMVDSSSDHFEEAKRAKKSLDLNLPLEEAEDDFLADGSRAWLEDFFNQVDGNVVFKPFNFDELADKLLTKIRLNFEKALRGGERKSSLEIDNEVMVQMLAAAWCSDKKGAIEDWIEQVLARSFAEIRERYCVNAESAVRLVSCEGVPVKEWVSSIWLPRSINLSI